MTTTASVGRSLKFNSRRAGRDAAQQALGEQPEGRADIALVFGTAAHNQTELLAGIRDVLGETSVVGCSGEGIITQSGSDECDCAVAVMLIQSDTIHFEPFIEEIYGEDSVQCAHHIVDRVEAGGTDDLMGVVIWPDGLSGNCTDLLGVLDQRLPSSAVVVGGAAADAMMMERTWQYLDGEVKTESLTGMVLRGKGRIEIAVSHGCTPVGLEHEITRMEDGWMHEIDGQPAWSVFKTYLDGDPEDLNAEGIVHLCIGKRLDKDTADGYSPYIIRTPLDLDADKKALFFPGGGIEHGESIRLARRDCDHIQASAVECAEKLLEIGKGKTPELILQFDCAGRGRILFGSGASDAIVKPLQAAIGKEMPWLGLHTLGEIAPIGGTSFYHNYTVVLCAIYDDDEEETTLAA